MKSIKVIALIAMMTVAFVSAQASNASAFALNNGYTGPVEFKFSDFSIGTLYDQSSGGYGNADGQEDAFGIFKITSIITPAVQPLWQDGQDGEELTGIFYGIDDDLWEITPAGGVNIQSVGGFIDVYLDGAQNFDPTLGPAARAGVSDYPTVTDGTLFLRLAFVPGIKFGNGFAGDDHIAYCFAEVDGFSKIGKYTGNGSTDGTFVYNHGRLIPYFRLL